MGRKGSAEGAKAADWADAIGLGRVETPPFAGSSGRMNGRGAKLRPRTYVPASFSCLLRAGQRLGPLSIQSLARRACFVCCGWWPNLSRLNRRSDAPNLDFRLIWLWGCPREHEHTTRTRTTAHATARRRPDTHTRANGRKGAASHGFKSVLCVLLISFLMVCDIDRPLSGQRPSDR